jgi:D-glycerate 3-kinase
MINKFFLDALTNKEIIAPIFDKSLHNGQGDRAGFKKFENVDILIFEGWFVGYRAVREEILVEFIKNYEYEAMKLAKFSNELLKSYEKAWNLLDL